MHRISARLKGMGIGSLFLTFFGGFWMVAALNTASWLWLVACVLVPTSLLAMRAIGLLLDSRRVRAGEPPPTPEEHDAGRALGRRFAWVFMIEFGAIALAANLLASTGRADWIVFAIALIVAVHFFPLARIFQFRLYYWTGGAEVVLCLLIAGAMRTRLQAADPLFGLAMGLSLWLTVVILLAQGARLAAAALPPNPPTPPAAPSAAP
ncbi:MAG TPA: hypothetical protein VNF74_14000 [Terriglobales bacterium]|nr:hypothetical protein [Terriglobales bacterium]